MKGQLLSAEALLQFSNDDKGRNVYQFQIGHHDKKMTLFMAANWTTHPPLANNYGCPAVVILSKLRRFYHIHDDLIISSVGGTPFS